ncbi:hypothetical protein C8R47DRAFT_1144744 [Mycena vitilis]|nr:hypothetical protein C8R47DRAFT_1144744 [Mycena vitilis]
MSFLRRFVQRLRSPTHYVGRDFEGNRYYEHPSVLDDPRPRRSVKYSGSEDMWKYVGGQRRLAVQWSSWLTHTRPDPPTLEELQADSRRQEHMRQKVALLAARDREEDRLKVAASSPAAVAQPMLRAEPETTAPPLPDPAAAPPSKPLPKMPSSTNSAEPEAWTPQSVTRGQ